MTQTEMTAALKPCRFCGDSDAQTHAAGSMDGPDYFVVCIACGAEGPKSDDRRHAEAAWNDHPNPALKAQGKFVAGDWVMVPREPTMTMLNAAIDTDPFKLGNISALGFRCSPQTMFERCYRAMIAAAPPRAPMKMLVDADWLRRKIEQEPDGMSCEAGGELIAAAPPRAPVVDDALIASIHVVRGFIGDEEDSRQEAGSHMSDYHNEATEAAQHFEAIIAALGEGE